MRRPIAVAQRHPPVAASPPRSLAGTSRRPAASLQVARRYAAYLASTAAGKGKEKSQKRKPKAASRRQGNGAAKVKESCPHCGS